MIPFNGQVIPLRYADGKIVLYYIVIRRLSNGVRLVEGKPLEQNETTLEE